MQPVPLEVLANFERRLDAMRVPPPQRPDYRKWVRFYFDFCHKYGHSTGAPASRGPSLAKLASKNQSVAQRSQAYASHLLLANYDLPTIQRLLGHSDIKTTMIYLQTVPSVTLKEAKSPLDCL